jgi:YHS domain-containing protein
MKKMALSVLTAGILAAVAGLAQGEPAAAMSGCTMPGCSMPGCNGMNTTAVADTNTNGVPDLLKTCPVSGDKLGGDMGGPYVFSYQGQEVKLCCKSCKKDFDKNPAKYMKLIRAADKK